MQRANFTSAAIFWADAVVGCAPPGASARHAWLAAMNVGLFGFRSLPGPPCSVIPTPPLLLGSGKSETPWLRTHRAYARNWAITPPEEAFDAGVWLLLFDPPPATPGPFEPP